MMLPEELIMLIKQNVNDYTSLTNLKMSCAYFNKVIRQFSLARELMRDTIDVYNHKLEHYHCVNNNCQKDAEEFYLERFVSLYHAKALNIAPIRINHKYYKACSPYCNTCFIKHVLIGDNTNARCNIDEDEYVLNIDY